VFGPEAHIGTMPKRDQGEALRQVEEITEVVRVVRNPLVVGGSGALGELLPATNEIRFPRLIEDASHDRDRDQAVPERLEILRGIWS